MLVAGAPGRVGGATGGAATWWRQGAGGGGDGGASQVGWIDVDQATG